MPRAEILPNFDERVLERMVLAVELVTQRLLRATKALESHSIPYAVAGGNAVAAWVAKVDPAAVRNTADVDLLLMRDDLERAKVALASAGFIYRHARGIDMFLDGPEGRFREAVHILFAGEKVRPDDPLPVPLISETTPGDRYQVVELEALVRMKLIANRRKDQVHLSDMLELEMIDETWLSKFPPELAARLQYLIDTPEG